MNPLILQRRQHEKGRAEDALLRQRRRRERKKSIFFNLENKFSDAFETKSKSYSVVQYVAPLKSPKKEEEEERKLAIWRRRSPS
jgi:hypothetical protein